MQWKAERVLPKAYTELVGIDLVKNKKQLKIVMWLSIVLAVIVALIGFAIEPIDNTFHFYPRSLFFAKLVITVLLMALYMVGHEAVHGAVMWAVSRVKPRFGLTLMYAFAGSDVYFPKASYLSIALAPVIVWGLVFALLCALLPQSWFWVIYLSQIFNFSGAAGDFYVAHRVLRMPSDVLVQDNGTAMSTYTKAQTDVQA